MYESWLILPFFDQVCLKNVSWCLFSNRVTSRLNSESSNARSHCPPLDPHVQDVNTSGQELIWSNDITLQNTSHTKLSTKRPKNMTPKRCQAQNERLEKRAFQSVCFCRKKKAITRPFAVQCLHHVEVDSTKATREDARKPEKDVLFTTYSVAKYTDRCAALYIHVYQHWSTCVSICTPHVCIYIYICYMLITSIHVYIMSMYMYCMSHIPSIVLKSV